MIAIPIAPLRERYHEECVEVLRDCRRVDLAPDILQHFRGLEKAAKVMNVLHHE